MSIDHIQVWATEMELFLGIQVGKLSNKLIFSKIGGIVHEPKAFLKYCSVQNEQMSIVILNSFDASWYRPQPEQCLRGCSPSMQLSLGVIVRGIITCPLMLIAHDC